MNGDQALVAIHHDINEMRKDLKRVTVDGCAKREGDMARILHVEKELDTLGNKLDRIFYVSLITAGGIIAFLLRAFLPYLLK